MALTTVDGSLISSGAITLTTQVTGTLPEANGGTGTTVGYCGFKNRIINGSMVIDQRNAGASVSIITAPFTLDRWAAQASTGGSVQQITSTITGFVNSFQYTSSASNAYLQMGQQIEYLNCYDLQNTTVSISFWAKANNSNAGSTALTVRTRTVAGVNGAARFAGTNVDTAVTITTSAVQYTVTRTLPATFGALSLEFVLGANVSGDGFEVTGVQLEKGSTATSFDYRPYGTELALCQRYYYKAVTGTLFNQLAFCNVRTTTSHYAFLQLPVTMRANPSSVDYSTIGVIASWGAGVVGLNSLTLADAAYGSGTTQVLLNAVTSSAVGTVGQISFLLGNNSTTGFVALNAEL